MAERLTLTSVAPSRAAAIPSDVRTNPSGQSTTGGVTARFPAMSSGAVLNTALRPPYIRIGSCVSMANARGAGDPAVTLSAGLHGRASCSTFDPER